MRRIGRRPGGGWITRGLNGEQQAPIEASVLRSIGAAWVVALVVVTFLTHPRPGLQGRGLLVLAGFALMLGSALLVRPGRSGPPGAGPAPSNTGRVIWGLLGVTAGGIVLALVQPSGIWLAAPYFVAIVGAVTLDRRWGLIMLAIAITPFTVGALAGGHVGTALSSSISIIPWYLILRLMRLLGERNRMLDASRAAEAQAAVVAE
ncbi:MAG TPA: hypothetical protein VME01_09460, partial [Solirubrobacteraceae bacterium]|nr:hypothetical protein [Solirubrobacteraceae bacterium]